MAYGSTESCRRKTTNDLRRFISGVRQLDVCKMFGNIDDSGVLSACQVLSFV